MISAELPSMRSVCPNNSGIPGEVALPVSVAQDDGFWRSRRVVLSGEPAPDDEAVPEEPEVCPP